MARTPITEDPQGHQVAWLAYRPITSGGVDTDHVEVRTGRCYMVKEVWGMVDGQHTIVRHEAHISPDNGFDAYSRVIVPVEDIEVLV